jgi:hypothetical protein
MLFLNGLGYFESGRFRGLAQGCQRQDIFDLMARAKSQSKKTAAPR